MDRDYCPFGNNMVPARQNFRGKPRGTERQSRLLHCSPLCGSDRNPHCLSLKLGVKQIDISFLDRGPFCIFLAKRSCMINMSLAPSVRAKTSSSHSQSSRVNLEKLMKLKDDARIALAELGLSHV